MTEAMPDLSSEVAREMRRRGALETRQWGAMKNRTERRAFNAVASELLKLWTMPAPMMVALGTIIGGAVISWALARSASQAGPHDVLAHVMPFLQVGAIVLGVLAVSQEYVGAQRLTTLRATPSRVTLAWGKTVAMMTAQVSVAVVATATSGAAAVLAKGGVPEVDGWRFGGFAIYLVCAGMISYGVALIMRTAAPSLVMSLALLLLLPPILRPLTSYGAWLPSELGRVLADHGVLTGEGPSVLAAGVGLAGWVLLAVIGGTVTLVKRDG